MATYTDRESFIPYSRADLIKLCLEDRPLNKNEAGKFRDFCEILAAYYHFKFHRTLEVIKENFEPFNPDSHIKPHAVPTDSQRHAMAEQLKQAVEFALQSANYTPLSQNDLELALEQESLITLKTEVDFEDFDQLLIYYRGDVFSKITITKFFLWKKELDLDIFERVILLFKFKDKAYFEAKGDKIENLDFEPGKIYVYMYKNIPCYDLELLFPNIKTSMNWKDRLLFGVPALGGGAAVVLKVLPNLLLLFGALVFFTFGPDIAHRFSIDETSVVDIVTLWAAVSSLLIGLGGFAFKQYTSYKNKKIEFQKNITETLFFKNMATNATVFHSLIDFAEEEKCKEIILVFYHLLTHPKSFTTESLDDHIETWLSDKLGVKVDFDIDKTLQELEQLEGKPKKDSSADVKVPLLKRDKSGVCHILPLDEALVVLDDMWDNFFLHANS